MDSEVAELRELAHALAELCMSMQTRIAVQGALIDALIGATYERGEDDLKKLREQLLTRASHGGDDVTEERRADFQSQIAERLRGIDLLLGRR